MACIKDTNTGIYTPDIAYAQRAAAMKSLFSRALKISSSDKSYQNSVLLVKSMFLKNGFSEEAISKVRHEEKARHEAQSNDMGEKNGASMIN